MLIGETFRVEMFRSETDKCHKEHPVTTLNFRNDDDVWYRGFRIFHESLTRLSAALIDAKIKGTGTLLLDRERKAVKLLNTSQRLRHDTYIYVSSDDSEIQGWLDIPNFNEVLRNFNARH